MNVVYTRGYNRKRSFSMKNTLRILGIIAMVAVIGFTMAACEDEPKEEKASVSIKGTPKIGEKLTATSKGGDFSGNFLWYIADSKDATSWSSLDQRYFGNFKFDGANQGIKKEGTTIPLYNDDVYSGEFDSEFTLRSELKPLVGKYIMVIRKYHDIIGREAKTVIGPITE